MDNLDEEILLLWKLLNQNHVKYIMVGGFATNFHGFSRVTADIDLWLDDSLENRKKFRKAIAEMGIGDFVQIETLDFVPGWTSIALNSGLELDVMTHLSSFEKHDFAECYSLANRAEIEGITVVFLHLNHLIREKKKCGRTKDLLDVEELLKIQNQTKL